MFVHNYGITSVIDVILISSQSCLVSRLFQILTKSLKNIVMHTLVCLIFAWYRFKYGKLYHPQSFRNCWIVIKRRRQTICVVLRPGFKYPNKIRTYGSDSIIRKWKIYIILQTKNSQELHTKMSLLAEKNYKIDPNNPHWTKIRIYCICKKCAERGMKCTKSKIINLKK